MNMDNQDLVLVTGGSGFIAGWCIVRLLQAGWRVRATLCPGERENDIRIGFEQEIDPGNRLSFVIATLDEDAGWTEATEGVTYIMHIASPVPSVMPKDDQVLIVPAREGTLRVLRAARNAKIKRVVMTSSTAAVSGRKAPSPNYIYTEKDWLDPSNPKLSSPYCRSKVAAEQAAWAFISGEGNGLELVTINPVWVLGPVLHPRLPASLQVIQKLLRGDLFGCPRLGWAVVDVRDIADLHLLAMTHPAAAYERFIGGAEWMWMHEIAAVLNWELGKEANHVPEYILPDFIVRLYSLFDPAVHAVVADLGRKTNFSFLKSSSILKWVPRSVDITIYETAQSILSHNLL